MNSLSDLDFELNYSNILKKASSATNISIDLRFLVWFDIWALIQILQIFENPELKHKSKIIELILPSGLSKTQKTDPNYTEDKIIARLKFLYDIGFLKCCYELGFEFIAQQKPGPPTAEQLKKMSLYHIYLIINRSEEVTLELNNLRPLIPITPISKLNLNETRNYLFTKLDKILTGTLLSEGIIKGAGLGDCLINELIHNVSDHATGQGYIALRAGLHLKTESVEIFEKQRRYRQNHPLGDWRKYYEGFLEEGYFELVVSDQGKGISNTILSDPRIPDNIKNTIDENQRRHELILHSLQPYSSRYSPSQRTEMGLPELTGLGAINNLIDKFSGSMLIREGKIRHYFGSKSNKSDYFTEINRKKSGGSGKNILPFIPGLTISALIPIRNIHHELPGFDLKNIIEEKIFSRFVKDKDDRNYASVFKVNSDLGKSNFSFLDHKIGGSWASISKSIRKFSPSSSPVILDIYSTSIDKNILWKGFRDVVRACFNKNISLIITGISSRVASRLEDFIKIDNGKILNGKTWIIFGIGDDSRGYSFGFQKEDNRLDKNLFDILLQKFVNQSQLSISEFSLLEKCNYVTEGDEIIKYGFFDAKNYLINHYLQLIKTEIENSDAWFNDIILRLPGGTKTQDFLDIHSLIQLPELFEDINRMVYLVISDIDFNHITSVGATSRITGKYLSNKISHVKSINYNAYYDYSHLDHGEFTKTEIYEDSNVVLILNGVRSGDHCSEVVRHIKDQNGSLKLIISLFYLSDSTPPLKIDSIPFVPIFQFSVRSAPPDKIEDYLLNPFTNSLFKIKSINSSNINIKKNLVDAYKEFEQFSIIINKHALYYDQHFLRSISLPFLLSSSSTLKEELIDDISQVINRFNIQGIVYPDHSSIGNLIEDLKKNTNISVQIKFIQCSFSSWTDGSIGYELDSIGSKILEGISDILIIDDQSYTGTSIKSMLKTCYLNNDTNLNQIVIYTVIDSLIHSERGFLDNLFFSEKNSDSLSIDRRFKLYSFSFMRIPLLPYWSNKTCPICSSIKKMEALLTSTAGYLESAYIIKQMDASEPISLYAESPQRPKLSPLMKDLSGITINRNYDSEDLVLYTIEALILYCEQVYTEGDVFWLVNILNRSNQQFEKFPIKVILEIIHLLSIDIKVISQLQIRNLFIKYISLLIKQGHFKNDDYNKLLEIISDWPLYYMNSIWNLLIERLFTLSSEELIDIYPGYYILLCEIEKRKPNKIQKKLLEIFDDRCDKFEKEQKYNVVEFSKKFQLYRSLKRNTYQKKNIIKSISAIISEISLILSYFAPVKSSHKILFRGLSQLRLITQTESLKKHLGTVQLLTELKNLLMELKNYPAKIFDAINETENINDLFNSIDEIKTIFDKDSLDQESIKSLIYFSTRVFELLYSFSDHRKTFANVLKNDLLKNRISLDELLNHLNLLKKDNPKFEIILNEHKNINDKEIHFSLDRASVVGIFDQLVSNLKKAYKIWKVRSGQSPQEEMFPEESAKFILKINILFNFDVAVFTFLNPSYRDIYVDYITKGEGRGLYQIKSYFDRLGLDYEYELTKEDYFKQVFELRRIAL